MRQDPLNSQATHMADVPEGTGTAPMIKLFAANNTSCLQIFSISQTFLLSSKLEKKHLLLKATRKHPWHIPEGGNILEIGVL